jgi:hypothetical protein
MTPNGSGQVLSVLLVEGDTEAIFYDRVKTAFLQCPCKIEVIGGLFSVNKKILHALSTKNQDRTVRAYCCLDQESRYAPTPAFDLNFIRAEVREKIRNVLSVDAIIARQMIESWFFHDMSGIYKYLRVPIAQRKPKAFLPVERLRVEDLKRLFLRYKKVYTEGKRAKYFINRLDIQAISAKCVALQRGVALIVNRG